MSCGPTEAEIRRSRGPAFCPACPQQDAAGVYHQAYQFEVLSAANFCHGQPAPGTSEIYEAQSPDGRRGGLVGLPHDDHGGGTKLCGVCPGGVGSGRGGGAPGAPCRIMPPPMKAAFASGVKGP